MSVSTSVYRCYGDGWTLLYVGCTGDVKSRITSHRRQSDWFDKMVHHRVRVYPTREQAEAVEKRTIRRFRPPHNKMDNPDWRSPYHRALDELRAENALSPKEGN